MESFEFSPILLRKVLRPHNRGKSGIVVDDEGQGVKNDKNTHPQCKTAVAIGFAGREIYIIGLSILLINQERTHDSLRHYLYLR